MNDLKKTSSLAETQHALAKAVRLGHSDTPELHPAQRLGIYTRLVHNNILGFINRCFTETPKFCDDEWHQAQQQFILSGQSHTSFFQEIAGEFLHYCQNQQLFNDDILALMDFEHTQLLAEVAMVDVPKVTIWDEHTTMQLSPASFLRSYPVNFISSNFSEMTDEPSNVLVWRNHEFDVYYQTLNEIDFGVLSYISEQQCSLQDLQNALSEVIANNIEFAHLLEQSWSKWVKASVIYPIPT